MNKTIVVTGASGQVGGAVVRALAAGGLQVRAATREPGNYRGEKNVTPVRLNYHEPRTIAPAFTGADGLFLIALPLDYHALELLAPVIDQASRTGIGQIVLHSALSVEMNEEAPLRKVERYLMASGVPYTILRSNFFMDNFATGSISATIKNEDGIFLPAGEGKTSFIATSDIAAVAAAAFTRKLTGKEYNLTGPEALDHYEVAAMLSDAAGRAITYHALDEGQFLANLRGRGLPDTAGIYLATLYAMVREGDMARITDDVRLVTGQEPVRFGNFATAQAWRWRKSADQDVPFYVRDMSPHGEVVRH
jgi:uncharacterized protein YbjT (DUF2867 family)